VVAAANRGIGEALAAEALRRDAGRVYIATRRPVTHPDGRVTPLTMDVTDRRQIQRAAEQVESLDMLINNAGIALYDDLSDRTALERHLAVNLLGTYDVIQAFLPTLQDSRGAIVNNLSVNAVAPLPLIPSGVRVHAVLTGPVDTDMTKGLEIPKADPAAVAQAIFDGVDLGQDEIFPDAMSQSLADGWRTGPAKTLEQLYSTIGK
jgi:NAD(P)-dependent dehydrogenase (short-subunit alcohol dehydrogenase family)